MKPSSALPSSSAVSLAVQRWRSAEIISRAVPTAVRNSRHCRRQTTLLGGLRDLAAKPSPEPDPKPTRTWPNLWQWLPTAASFAMLVILLVDLRVVVNDTGFTIAFGAPQAALEPAVDSDAIDSLLARFEQRQDQNNLALMQAVLTQTREANAASFTQLLTYFEEQRLRDMDELRVSYEQLVSTDYETVRSLQQLANFVSYGETVR